MSEQLRPQGEIQHEQLDLSKETEKNLERLKNEALEASNDTLPVAELENTVEQTAVSAKEVTIGERETQSQFVPGLHQDLKQTAYKRIMERTQSNLSAPERTMSKIVHQPVIEAMSNIAGKTVARPSGILGGGLLALLGSLALSYFSRYYGFEYNFVLFGILFGGGFVLGLVAELLIRTIRH